MIDEQHLDGVLSVNMGKKLNLPTTTPLLMRLSCGVSLPEKGITLSFLLTESLVQQSGLTQGSNVNIIISELSSDSSSLRPVRVSVQESPYVPCNKFERY